jgi:GR25 family glycosyltransferase involved in LPS biosynthesis
MDNSYSAYVISLEQPTTLLNSINDIGIKANLVEGVNGKTLDNETIKKNTTYFGRYFATKSTIGIAMAHIKAWKTFLKSGEKYGLIFEDDAVFEDNFKERLDIILNNTPKDVDILYLGCIGCNNPINISSIILANTGVLNLNIYKNNDTNNEYVNKSLLSLGLHGYVLSRKGAKKLIQYIEGEIYTHIDFHIQTLSANKLINSYTLNDLIVYQTSTDETQSSNVTNTHPLLLNNILSNYYIEKKVKASYISSLSLIRINNINLNACSILFIIIGSILGSTSLDFFTVTALYILLSIPDLYINLNNNMIKIHYLLLILPFLGVKLYMENAGIQPNK